MNQIVISTFFSAQILTLSNVLGNRISQTKCDEYQSMFPLLSTTFNESGQDASPKQFPFMARIYNDNGAYSNGILLSENFVLTIVLNGSAKYVFLGDSDHLTYSVDALQHVHPSHTLKLLKLNKWLQFDEYVQPVCLSQPKSNISQQLIEIGWSEISDQNDTLLHRVKLDFVSNTECLKEMATARVMDGYSKNYSRGINIGTHFCAAVRKSDRDVCRRFDGAALFNDGVMVSNSNEVVGIALINTGCGKYNRHMFHRVSEYISWIESIVWPSEIELIESTSADIEASVTPNLSSSMVAAKSPLSSQSSGHDEVRKIIFIVMLIIALVLLCVCGILVLCILKYKTKNRQSRKRSDTRVRKLLY